MMADQNKTDRTNGNSIDEGDAAVTNKKSLGVEDIRFAFTDDKPQAGDEGASRGFSNIIVWVFSLMLLMTGVFVMIFTAATVFGIALGLIMIVAAVILPFYARGNWIKRNVE